MRSVDTRMKKGQVAMEFVALVGIAFFTFLTFLVIILYHTQQLREQKDDELLVDVSLTVQNELNSASTVKDGYYRQFTVPTTLDGKTYSITKHAGKLYFDTAKQSTFIITPEYEGNVQLGINIITKKEGVVHVNDD